MSRRSRKILIGIGVVMVVLGALYGVSLARAKAKLRQAYAALEQDGRPMDPNEVLPPEVPDAENAAVLYERAVAMMKAESVEDKDLLEYLGKRAGKFLSDSLDPRERAQFEELIGREVVAKAFSVVAEAGQRPSCRFNRPGRVALHVDPPIAQDLRSLTLILSARALQAAQRGQSREAWEMVEIQLGLVEKLRRDPVIPGPWVRFGVIGHAARMVRQLCEIAPPDEQEYRVLQNRLLDLDAVEPFVRSVDAERLVLGERLFTLPEHQLYEVLKNDPWSGGDGMPEVLQRLYFRFVIYRPRFIADHANYLQLMRQSVHLLESPFVPRTSAARQEIDDLVVKYPLTSRLAIMSYGLKSLHCRMAADVRMTRAGLGLLQYKRAQGVFPATLEALNLERLIDPYIEQPLHYRAEDDSFIVYSVGGDLHDNGGRPQQRRDGSDPRKKRDPEYDQSWRFGHAQRETADEESQS